MTYLLAIGGACSDAVTGRIERYDLLADRWTLAGHLEHRRDCHRAAIVGDRIYVSGGRNADFEDDNAVEHSDLTAREWVADAWLRDPRHSHAAVGAGGKLYVLGGIWGNDHHTSIDAFDPDAGRWSRCGELPVALGLTIATSIGGRLWIFGEVQPFQWELWSGDLPSGPWAREATLTLDRRWPAVCASGSSFYVCGGTAADAPTARVDRLDLADRSLQALPDLLAPRSGAAAVAASGRVYVMGGYDARSFQRCAALESFDPADRSWRNLAPLPEGRSELCAVAID